MNNITWIIIACAVVLLAGIGRVRRASEDSGNPDVVLNGVTLSFVAAVGIVILIALAALSTK